MFSSEFISESLEALTGGGTARYAHSSSLGSFLLFSCSFPQKLPNNRSGNSWEILDPPLRMSGVNVERFNRPS